MNIARSLALPFESSPRFKTKAYGEGSKAGSLVFFKSNLVLDNYQFPIIRSFNSLFSIVEKD